jgi:hypothetical protein
MNVGGVLCARYISGYVWSEVVWGVAVQASSRGEYRFL